MTKREKNLQLKLQIACPKANRKTRNNDYNTYATSNPRNSKKQKLFTP